MGVGFHFLEYLASCELTRPTLKIALPTKPKTVASSKFERSQFKVLHIVRE
jgi:hypothetical protein